MNARTTRRELLTAAAAFGAAGTIAQAPAVAADAGSPARSLPSRGEFTIRNAYVLSMDPQVGDLPHGDIHVRNGTIVEVGTNVTGGGEVIDGRTMIAIPGLIETHWHMWGAVARNMAGDDPKTGYFPFSRVLGVLFTPEDNARGVRLALAEALNTGLTTVHNWSHNLLKPPYADAELAAHISMGGRARFSYGYSRNTGPNETLPLDDVVRVQKQYFSGQTDLLTLGIASRGPENNTMEICKREWEFARRLHIPVTSHIGTDPKKTFGIKALADAGLLGPDTQLVHATNVVAGDVERVGKSGTHVSVSPYTEMRTGFGFGPITEYIQAGVPLSLSIDTTILCGHADMFATMRGLQNQEDGRKQSEFALAARKVLEIATIGGARDLGIADKVGSLTPGKRADIVLVRTDDLNIAPFTEPVHMIVQSAHPMNVDTVVVDGRILKRHGRLTAIDVPKLLAQSQETIDRVRSKIGTVTPTGCALCGETPAPAR
jgi:cytosine/adenosine deaminase-related metal-dependent hydrolase